MRARIRTAAPGRTGHGKVRSGAERPAFINGWISLCVAAEVTGEGAACSCGADGWRCMCRGCGGAAVDPALRVSSWHQSDFTRSFRAKRLAPPPVAPAAKKLSAVRVALGEGGSKKPWRFASTDGLRGRSYRGRLRPEVLQGIEPRKPLPGGLKVTRQRS